LAKVGIDLIFIFWARPLVSSSKAGKLGVGLIQ